MTSIGGALHGDMPVPLRNPGLDAYTVEVFLGPFSKSPGDCISILAKKSTSAEEIVEMAVEKLLLGNRNDFELTEVFSSGGQICKERRLVGNENPVKIQLLWPRLSSSSSSSSSISDIHQPGYNFMLRRKEPQQKLGVWVDSGELNTIDGFLSRFLQQPRNREYQDLCNLPDLNETTLLENLKKRFKNDMIYTYVGSILISINPFRFFPIYNPKYVRMYQNRRLSDLPPHIFAIADSAYHAMMTTRANQCIVISGESGSGKTESTNLLLHHLSALSQRGFCSDGIEQSILGVGPVLEAFGNAKTVHNNNSSRFGKFVQVNYRANGSVHGASVEKYLLEKSRIVSQASNERNYHVFYYLLAGATAPDIEAFCLGSPRDYFYLNQNDCYRLEGLDSDNEALEFARLRHAMDIVGFSHDNQHRIFTVLSAVLHIGNIEFKKKSEHGHHHEAVSIKNMKEISIVSKLLKVKESTLTEALTTRKTMAGGEIVVMSYKMPEAISTRDATAKCLYSALFDWIVFQINTALVSKHDRREHEGNSIGVLDIFGFEDFQGNSFEQFCINYANESLHYYFNQHIFKFEQEEYTREGIQWKNIEFIDNTECLDLFSKKPTGLLYLLDEECSFPGATNDTLLNKFRTQHQNSPHFEVPQTRQSAFNIIHYAGKVKYHIQDFREKNNDLMRHDIRVLLKNSNMAFLRELIGQDPLAVMRWALVRVFFRACFAFIDAGRRHRKSGSNARFGISSRPEQPPKRSHLSDSRASLFGDKSRAKMDTRQLSHSPSLEFWSQGSPRSASFIGSRMFRKRPGRRMSCPGEHAEAALDAVKIYQEYEPAADKPQQQQQQQQQQQKGSPKMNAATALKLQKSPATSTKNKMYRPRFRAVQQLREMETNKTLATGKIPLGMRTSKSKSKPPSISAQFHTSLQRLMDTLNQANPFFIRCIKSNAEKLPCVFDEELVQRQLRYTGMLATVKIRQSGYNYRLSFEDFVDQYHLLLPSGRKSGRSDILKFLQKLDLNQENYQIGAHKVFLRETEKLLVEDALHQALLGKIKSLQHWYRGRSQRARFLQMKSSSVMIQAAVRGFIARRQVQRLQSACVLIQSVFRGFSARRAFKRQMSAIVKIQSVVRGFVTRTRLTKQKKDAEEKLPCDVETRSTSNLQNDVDSVMTPAEDVKSLIEDKNIEQELDAKNADYAQVVTGADDGLVNAKNNMELLLIVRISDANEENRSGRSFAMNEENVSVTSNGATKVLEAEDYSQKKHLDSETGVGIVPKYPTQHDSFDGACVSQMQPNADVLSDKSLLLDLKLTQNENRKLDSNSAGEIEFKEGDVIGASDSKSSAPDKVVFSLDDTVREQYSPDSLSPPVQIFPLPNISMSKSADKVTTSRSAPPSPTDFHASELPESLNLPSALNVEGRDHLSYLKLKRDKSPLSRRTIEKSQSAILPKLRTQPGPQDLEVEVKPAIVKASSEEILSFSYQMSRSLLQDKKIVAPLARMESMTDDVIAEEDNVETVHLLIEEDEKKMLPLQRNLDDHYSNRSPFHRAKKHLKEMITKDGTTTSAGEGYDNSSRKMKHGYHWKGGKAKQPVPLPTTSESSSSTPVPTGPAGGTWNVSGTAQWQYPLDAVARNIQELKQLEQFFTTKIVHFKKANKTKSGKESVFDVVFKEALTEFRSNLLTQVSTALQENTIEYRYRDLMFSFEKVLTAKARQHETTTDAQHHEKTTTGTQQQPLQHHVSTTDEFLNTVFINAFRGFLDEFIRKRDNKELPDVKIKKASVKTKKKKENIIEYNGHKFLQIQFTIPTFCEMCSSVIWVLEKGFVCKVCKLPFHKKCYEKSPSPCVGSLTQAALVAQMGSSVIGVPLNILMKDGSQIPTIIDQLIHTIEMNGLYTVGLYRKSGNAAQIKQLIKLINTSASQIDFGEYHIHVLTAVTKTFFRDMPEPLMTFDLYGDFICVTEITDEKERTKSLFNLLNRLPPANYLLLERLIFHLARVAQQESSNYMSTNALAIIFAPSMLKSPNELLAQESLNHVPKQTLCIQCIIESQLKKIRNTLADIKSLDTAEVSANEKLATLRASKRQCKLSLVENGNEEPNPQPTTPDDHDEIILLTEIQSYQDEKETLTSQMVAFECRESVSEDDMLSTDEVESTGDELEELDDESLISADNGYERRVACKLARNCNQPLPQRSDKYLYLTPLNSPDSPCELNPARSDPEIHDANNDPFN